MSTHEKDNESVTGVACAGFDSGVLITTLAELPERALLDERALARALGVTKRTVRRMVARFELPPPVSFAGRAMWQVGRVLAWFESRAERASRQAARNASRMEQLF
jgi:predicted DNA-binding transcriptional regulator AlpA